MKAAIRGPAWQQESPFRWYSYSWVSYNYGRFNLALNRKVFGLRYGNPMSGSIGTAEGTNLFSGTQTNFPLVRTTHWAPFSYPLNNRDEQVFLLLLYTGLWDMEVNSQWRPDKRRPIEPLCSWGNTKDQLMNSFGPPLAWVCKACSRQ